MRSMTRTPGRSPYSPSLSLGSPLDDQRAGAKCRHYRVKGVVRPCCPRQDLVDSHVPGLFRLCGHHMGARSGMAVNCWWLPPCVTCCSPQMAPKS